MSQDICYISRNCESKLFTVSAYTKGFLSIVEIENNVFHRYYKWKTPIELVPDKLITSLDG